MKASTLTALGEPNRLRIIELLRSAPYTVGEIAERLQLRQPQVSKHLKVLNEAGVVRVRPKANQRFYQLEALPFEELDEWLDSFRELLEKRFQHLDDLLEEMKQEGSQN